MDKWEISRMQFKKVDTKIPLVVYSITFFEVDRGEGFLNWMVVLM
jgi:hypothetical protein